MNKNFKKQKGITLIALVVTILVLIILAGVTLNMILSDDGIIKQAKEERLSQEEKADMEAITLAMAAQDFAIEMNGGQRNSEDLKAELEKTYEEGNVTVEEIDGFENEFKVTINGDENRMYRVDIKGIVTKWEDIEVGTSTPTVEPSEVPTTEPTTPIIQVTPTPTPEEDTTEGVKVTLDGETVTLTKDNYASYLGKVVTNYKLAGGTETVTVSTENFYGESTFTVSTTYRLYYIDFDNKYGDGEGTVYLKADCCTNIGYPLSTGKTTSDATIKNLNPSLYAEGVTPPTSTNENMKAVTWLLDKTEWNGLVTSGASTEIASSVNYVVGAPSLEMMIDSFNAHYGLTGGMPDYSDITTSSARTKLFYKYTAGADGYQVGPCSTSSDGYGDTTINTIQSDSNIDSMYYGWIYWLASPSVEDSLSVCLVAQEGNFAHVSNHGFYQEYAFCPLVSLKSDVQLELQ